MTATELAQAMLQWGELQQQADVLAAEIQAAVLELGKTQTVGNVRATYSKGRTSYDYEAGARTLDEGILDGMMARYHKMNYNWMAICEVAGIEAPVKSESEPSVSLEFVS